jgi:hypothetical protein
MSCSAAAVPLYGTNVSLIPAFSAKYSPARFGKVPGVLAAATARGRGAEAGWRGG